MEKSSVFVRISSALSTLGKRKQPDEPDGNSPGASHAPSPKHRAPITFRPWDQRDLHRRLLTFRPLTWFAKPDSVGPIACAARGWSNTARDTLECEFCSATLIYPPSSIPYEHRRHVATLFAEQLVTKHASHCPWKSTRCDDECLSFKPPSGQEEKQGVIPYASPSFQGVSHDRQHLLNVDQLPELEPRVVASIVGTTCGTSGPWEAVLHLSLAERPFGSSAAPVFGREAMDALIQAKQVQPAAAPSSPPVSPGAAARRASPNEAGPSSPVTTPTKRASVMRSASAVSLAAQSFDPLNLHHSRMTLEPEPQLCPLGWCTRHPHQLPPKPSIPVRTLMTRSNSPKHGWIYLGDSLSRQDLDLSEQPVTGHDKSAERREARIKAMSQTLSPDPLTDPHSLDPLTDPLNPDPLSLSQSAQRGEAAENIAQETPSNMKDTFDHIKDMLKKM
eukprot:gene7607-761_t